MPSTAYNASGLGYRSNPVSATGAPLNGSIGSPMVDINTQISGLLGGNSPLQPYSLGGDQNKPLDAFNYNTENTDQITALSNLINSINQGAQQAANAARIPNAGGLEAQSSGSIGQALAGNLPPDVINQIGRAAAERGAATGSPLGAGTQAAFLKDIGLNSLNMMNTGQDWLTKALGRNPTAPLFDPSNLMLTPYQAGSLNNQQAQLANARYLAGLEAALKLKEIDALNRRALGNVNVPSFNGGGMGGGGTGRGFTLGDLMGSTGSGGGMGGGVSGDVSNWINESGNFDPWYDYPGSDVTNWIDDNWNMDPWYDYPAEGG